MAITLTTAANLSLSKLQAIIQEEEAEVGVRLSKLVGLTDGIDFNQHTYEAASATDEARSLLSTLENAPSGKTMISKNKVFIDGTLTTISIIR